MAKLLFKLNNVPDEEADEIRQLLDEKQVDYYETTAGNWGLSFAAIWLKNDQDFLPTKELIDDYQNQRYQRVTQAHQALREAGENLTRWQVLKNSPIRVIATLIFISFVCYFTIAPFFSSSIN